MRQHSEISVSIPIDVWKIDRKKEIEIFAIDMCPDNDKIGAFLGRQCYSE